MSAIQNQKALWHKKSQCEAKDVKRKTKTASHVNIAKSKCRTNSYAENPILFLKNNIRVWFLFWFKSYYSYPKTIQKCVFNA